jgi:transcriptional regulator with XRE-family HTH domain
MHEAKRRRLHAKGWKLGSTAEFLRLSPEESAFIELKLQLAADLRARRRQQHLTQWDLAKMVRSSQSRVAKMESGHPSVSLDLLVRTLLALGASSREIARTMVPRRTEGVLRDAGRLTSRSSRTAPAATRARSRTRR